MANLSTHNFFPVVPVMDKSQKRNNLEKSCDHDPVSTVLTLSCEYSSSKKRKSRVATPEKVTECQDDEVSTVLTLSCDYSSSKDNKARVTTPEKEIECHDNEVSTVLSLSCNYFSRKRKQARAMPQEIESTADQVLTELTLSNKSWIASIPSDKEMCRPVLSMFCGYLSRMSERARVATEEISSTTDQATELNHPFVIKKKLKESDLGNLCRLLVSTGMVKKHVLPHLSSDVLNAVHGGRGAPVVFWDVDTRTEHKMVFKKWATSGSYVFIDGWCREFVRRRNLVHGDEIGIYWDLSNSRFNFSVVGRRA